MQLVMWKAGYIEWYLRFDLSHSFQLIFGVIWGTGTGIRVHTFPRPAVLLIAHAGFQIDNQQNLHSGVSN